MIDRIKKELSEHEYIHIKYDLGRNKYEEYEVKIENLYNRVFTVKLKDNRLKSFSYNDIITKTIKIKYWFYKKIILQLNCTLYWRENNYENNIC